MLLLKEKIKITANKLLTYSTETVSRIDGIEYVECGYKKNNIPPYDGWKRGNTFVGSNKHFWLRGHFHTPKAEQGYTYMLSVGTGIKGWDATNPQGLLYLNGKMVQGLDVNHTEAFVLPDTDYEMHNYFYMGNAEGPVTVKSEIIKIHNATEALYYDIIVPFEACELYNENTAEYRDTMSVLEQTVNLIDLRYPRSERFYKSVREAAAFLKEEYYDKLCTKEGKPTVHLIGHTHIDVEWQWARNQTREKMQRSFSSAAALMEKYPEYLFTLSQPELYRYLSEEAPEKYEELKNLVKDGRWEPEGAMWVECDCNLVSGESFVRQIIQGKKFFKEEFGKDSKILFLPDVFGYSAALPQILKKAGVDYFVTSKISWNDTNTLPVDSFIWQGIDGTEIYSSFITAQKAQKDHKTSRYTTYVGKIDPAHVLGTWERYQQKEYNKHTILTFGFGDGGGGPTREMLEKGRRLEKGLPGLPAVKYDFLLPTLEEAKKEFDKNSARLKRTPKWVGELYLEFHRGTYTSIAKVKRGNRKSEFLLAKTEALSYTDLLFGGNYDSEGIYAVWRKVLHNQFHDILPGSSIFEVYEGTDKDYAQINAYCNGVVGEKLAEIASNLKTDGGLLVYNPLGFERKGTVSVNGKTVELGEAIPAFGWKVIKSMAPECNIRINGLEAENSYYIMKLDECGRIISLYDKDAEREVVLDGNKANEFCAFEDYPHKYDAWELENTYKSKMYVLDDLATIEAFTDGDSAGFKITHKYFDSTVCQTIRLYNSSRRIDFENDIDWHEKHQVLKIAFPIDVHAERAAYEIQFGHVYRPTHENTSWDSAKFEVCAHKWVDISENGYGVSLLNDCKYGFNAEGTTLSLTALKCADYPNPYADEGRHVFTYSLFPHIGSFCEAGTIRESYSLNQPLEAVEVKHVNGTLPESFSLVSCDAKNVVVETVKKAENTDDMIVRMYEAFDSRSKVTLTVPEFFKSAYICDLMENELEPLELVGGKVTFPIKNFEIVTLKFKK